MQIVSVAQSCSGLLFSAQANPLQLREQRVWCDLLELLDSHTYMSTRDIIQFRNCECSQSAKCLVSKLLPHRITALRPSLATKQSNPHNHREGEQAKRPHNEQEVSQSNQINWCSKNWKASSNDIILLWKTLRCCSSKSLAAQWHQMSLCHLEHVLITDVSSKTNTKAHLCIFHTSIDIKLYIH